MMTRRTAIGTMMAGMLAPLVKLRPEIDRERILRSFCLDFETYRYSIKDPFGFGSATYATDGRHVVRTELVSRVEDGSRRVPNMDELWRVYWSENGSWRPFELPAIDALTDYSEYLPCPLCDDRRVSLGDEYPEFGPTGEPVDHSLSVYGYDVDDNSIRDKSCPLCRGLIYHGPNAVRFQGVLMSYTRLKPIAAIKNVELVAGNPTHRSLLFRGDGFEGIALGINEDRLGKAGAAQ